MYCSFFVCEENDIFPSIIMRLQIDVFHDKISGNIFLVTYQKVLGEKNEFKTRTNENETNCSVTYLYGSANDVLNVDSITI